MRTQEGIDFAHARNKNDVAGLVRPRLLQDVFGKRRRAADLLQLLALALRARFELLLGNSLEDALVLAKCQEGVVQVDDLEVARKGSALGIVLQALNIGADLKLQRGIVAKRVEADLVANALVCQKVRLGQTLAKDLATMLQVLAGTLFLRSAIDCHSYITCPVKAWMAAASPRASIAPCRSGSKKTGCRSSERGASRPTWSRHPITVLLMRTIVESAHLAASVCSTWKRVKNASRSTRVKV